MDPDGLLTWNDFRGPINLKSGFGAVFRADYKIEAFSEQWEGGDYCIVWTKDVKYHVTIDKEKSWTRFSEGQPGLLRHETGHLKIAELIVKQAVDNLYTVVETACDCDKALTAWKSKTDAIIAGVVPSMAALQSLYDYSTGHGADFPESQKAWEKALGVQ